MQTLKIAYCREVKTIAVYRRHLTEPKISREAFVVEPICLEVYAELRTGTKDVSSSLRPRELWEAEYKLSKL